ncbi:MAG: hypothetical protein VX466_15055 [Myxococcota bacterium]|nr:hypothetical protein [Myxococcota bacterium]
MRTFKLTGLAALFLLIGSPAFAGDANTVATGQIEAFDVNQGASTQTNADDWEMMDNALAGSGSQTVDTGFDANTGTGEQDNSTTSQDHWEDMSNANSGIGAQVIDATNSNGGDRTSSDIVLTLGNSAVVATGTLEASVSGNSVSVSGDGGSASSSLHITDGSGFRNMAGVNAIALSSGHNSSQNVNVNVTASVTTSAGGTHIE